MENFTERPLIVGLALGGVLVAGGYALYRRWVAGKSCRSKATLTGKTVIVTGANTGIGLETTLDLAGRGARVILACRSEERGERAAVQVRRKTGNQNIHYVHLDLASMQSIRTFAKRILEEEPHIDILVNNAGVLLSTYKQTEDGFEATMGVNHLGPFLLTNLLLPRMLTTQNSRIVNVSSTLYKHCSELDLPAMQSLKEPANYSRRSAYCQSKLANILFTRALSRRLEGTSVCTYALHPGAIFTTDLGREVYKDLPLYQKVSY